MPVPRLLPALLLGGCTLMPPATEEAPIARLADLRPGLTPEHAAGQAAALGLPVSNPPEAAPCGRRFVVAVPHGDACTPQGAFLLCPGLRMLVQGEGPDAPVVGLWHTIVADTPLVPAAAVAAAERRWGRPATTEQMRENIRGRDLALEVSRWRPPGEPPREVELSLVLGPDGAAALGLASVALAAGICETASR